MAASWHRDPGQPLGHTRMAARHPVHAGLGTSHFPSVLSPAYSHPEHPVPCLCQRHVSQGLSPWLGHPNGMSPSPAAAGSCQPSPCCQGCRAMGGGCTRVLPEARDPHSLCHSSPCDLPPTHCVPLARGEAKDAGLTVVLDARKQPPAPALFSALQSVQVRRVPCACAMDVPGVPAWEQVLPPFGVPQSLPCAHCHPPAVSSFSSSPRCCHAWDCGFYLAHRFYP